MTRVQPPLACNEIYTQENHRFPVKQIFHPTKVTRYTDTRDSVLYSIIIFKSYNNPQKSAELNNNNKLQKLVNAVKTRTTIYNNKQESVSVSNGWLQPRLVVGYFY